MKNAYVQNATKCKWVFVIVYEIVQGGIDSEKICCYHFYVISGNVSGNVSGKVLNERGEGCDH